MRRTTHVTIALVTGLGLVLGACSNGADDGPDDGAPDPSGVGESEPGTEDAPEPTGAPEDDEASGDLPETPAGDALAFVLDAIQPNQVPSADTAAERFDAAFLREVPPGQVVRLFGQFATDGPWDRGPVAGQGAQLSTTVRSSTDQELRIDLAVDPEGRIAGLFFRPVPPEPAFDDLDDAAAALAEHAERTGLLVARIGDGAGDGPEAGDVTAPASCEPTVADASARPHAVASTAKLYVLHAVADAVAAGEVTWDDEVALTDADRSLPSGVLQDEPTGTTRTVAELALGMIAISDNTATDHLLTLVGRGAVEQAVVDAGHDDPGALQPYLRTREAFAIGWDDDRREAWPTGDTTARRELLADLPDGTAGIEVEDLLGDTGPVWPDGVDWFASLEDVCGVHAALDLADAAVLEAVGTNPGLPLDATWTRRLQGRRRTRRPRAELVVRRR